MTSRKADQHRPPDDALWLVPLGGSGEIGMNFNLYGTQGKWLIVDCGITFPDETMPGIEVVMPDISFIAERKDDIVGMVITHGHEDHLGAIEHLWGRLQCPIYATPFTAEMIRGKTSGGRDKKKKSVRLVEMPVGGKFEIGPFQVDMIPVTHSIPEAHMLLIGTKLGKVLHTGDWKFDPHPIVGKPTNMETLKALGKQNIMALVGDSTNALVDGHSGSELEAQKCLKSVFERYHNRIAVTCFASNIARVKSVYEAAHAVGREVALVGRSLWRNAEIAEGCGYLPEFKNFLSEEEAMQAPRDKIVLMCTGCQGEGRAALARIAVNDHPDVELEENDVVIFSSREIPGNEKPIGRVQNLLLEQGIEILTSDNDKVHVSGHAAQEEMRLLYQMVKPKAAVLVHGELRHQTEHERIAHESGVKETIIPINGEIIKITPEGVSVVGDVPVGRMGLDGKFLRPLTGEALKTRRKLGFNGAVVVSIVLNRRGEVAADPQISLLGVEDNAMVEELRDELCDLVLDAVEKLTKKVIEDDAAVRTAVTQSVKRMLNDTYGKRPMLDVNLMRI